MSSQSISQNYSKMEWADYSLLDTREYFFVTRSLFDLEVALHNNIANSLHCSRRFEYPWAYYNLQPFDKDDIILDAGAGDTILQFFLSKMVRESHSLDLALENVERAIEVKNKNGFKNVFPLVGDILSMTYPSDYFDKVICISVLEHVPKEEIDNGINELIRVTKPGGKLAITMDVVFEKTDKQMDIDDFIGLADRYSLTLPEPTGTMMVFRVPPHKFPFGIACILIEKGEG